VFIFIDVILLNCVTSHFYMSIIIIFYAHIFYILIYAYSIYIYYYSHISSSILTIISIYYSLYLYPPLIYISQILTLLFHPHPLSSYSYISILSISYPSIYILHSISSITLSTYLIHHYSYTSSILSHMIISIYPTLPYISLIISSSHHYSCSSHHYSSSISQSISYITPFSYPTITILYIFKPLTISHYSFFRISYSLMLLVCFHIIISNSNSILI
jgi:hypothetical protein